VNTPTTPKPRSDRESALIVVAAMAGLMWLTEVIDQVTNANLDQYGIKPHEADGLVGIATAPFLHAGFGHLIGNTIPFLVLGAMIALSGLGRVLATTAIVAVVGGLGVWLFAPTGTDHIGASGIVFGYATYLVARGLFSRSLLHLAIGVVVLAIYGTTLLSGLVPTDGISWQGHLFGGIGGIVAARVLDRRDRRTQKPGDPVAALPDYASRV
jgi:membrane associated rhomboid family serine protease